MAQQVERDREFLARAMREHGPSVLRLALSQTGSRADAEDVYQDVFVALARRGEHFADAGHLRAWLLRATLNHCRDLARSWWRRNTQSFDELRLDPPARQEEAPVVPPDELWAAVQRLPERYRAVVHLRYVEELPVSSIAALCDISESAVRTRLSRAVRKLSVYLGRTS